MPLRVLVVDAEPLKRVTLQVELSEHGHEVFDAADARGARRIIDSQQLDVVVTEERLPEMSGLDLLTYVKQRRPQTAVILMTGYASVASAVLAIKRGAFDYLSKPFTTQELVDRIRRLPAVPGRPDEEVASYGTLITCSPALKREFQAARRAAETGLPLLITGEFGVGKTALAQATHAAGSRADRPLLTLAFAAPADDTPAPDVGEAFSRARYGCLLIEGLDRAAPVAARQLQRRVAASEGDLHAPLLISTSVASFERLTTMDHLPPDLLDRLGALVAATPPLRERPGDVRLLAERFANDPQLGADGPVRLAAETLEELLRYDWPGNVRELRHVIVRALAYAPGDVLRPEHVLPLGARDADSVAPPLETFDAGRRGLNEALAEIERRLIVVALRQCDGNQARAAEKLGIPRTTLRDKIAKYNLSLD